MTEIKTKLETYQVDFVCEVCNNGYLVAEKMLLTDPPKWNHVCTNKKCSNNQIFEKKYPNVEHRFTNDDIGQ